LIQLTQKILISILNSTPELFFKVHSKKFDSVSSEIIEESYDETTDVFT
jgi:hypothetical protein